MTDDKSNKPGGLLSSSRPPAPHPAAGGIATQPPSGGYPEPIPQPNWLWNRPVVNGLWYNGKVIHLDGYNFVNCRFDNCTLIVSSSNFELTNCFIDPNTAVRYDAEPLKIIKLFNTRSQWMYEKMPDFAPIKNPDGTITIVGNKR